MQEDSLVCGVAVADCQQATGEGDFAKTAWDLEFNGRDCCFLLCLSFCYLVGVWQPIISRTSRLISYKHLFILFV